MKYCEHIAHTLSFNLNEILPCCTGNSHFAPKHFSILDNDIEYLSTLDIENSQKFMFKELNSSNFVNYSCAKCIYLKEVEELEKENNQINCIFLRFWTKCNCNCVYCDSIRANISGLPEKYSPYNLIKKLYENNKIDSENLIVKVQGGDLSVLPDFENYIALFKKYGYKEIHFSTNNIIYQKSIEEILKKNKGSLNVSVDCGSKETYLKIKQVDCFDEVINNLCQYLSKIENHKSITIHYIIAIGYNDNKKEINKFLKLMKKIGIVNVGIRIDHQDLDNYLKNKLLDKNMTHYKNLINFFNERARKYKFTIDEDFSIEQNFVLARNQQNSLLKSSLKLFKGVKNVLP